MTLEVMTLAQSLCHPNPFVRYAVALDLRDYKLMAPILVPDLIVALSNEPLIGVGCVIVDTLGEFGAASAPAVPTLVTLLNCKHEQIQEHAAWALGQIGPAAKQAVDKLTELRTSPRAEVRAAAERAIELICV